MHIIGRLLIQLAIQPCVHASFRPTLLPFTIIPEHTIREHFYTKSAHNPTRKLLVFFSGEDPSDKFYVLRPRSAKSRVRGQLKLSHFYAASNEDELRGATGSELERAHGSEVSSLR